MLGKNFSEKTRRYFIGLIALTLLLAGMVVYFSNTPCQTARYMDDNGKMVVNRITDLGRCQEGVNLLQFTTIDQAGLNQMQGKIDSLRVKRMGSLLLALISAAGAGFFYFRPAASSSPNKPSDKMANDQS